MDERRINRIFVRALVVSVALSAVLAAGFFVFGEEIVRNAYDGGTFGGIVKARIPDGRTFEQYFADSTPRFWNNAVIGLPLSIIILFLLLKLYRSLLARIRTERPILSVLPESHVRGGVWIAIALYTAATAVLFHSILGVFATRIIGPPGDNMACLWTLNWASQHLFSGERGIGFINDILYPEGNSFYLHAWSFYNAALYSALRQFFANATCYNILILHSFVLAGTGGYLLAKYFLRNHWLALVTGFLFAFNPAHIERAIHHMNIATIQFIPLFVLFYVKAIKENSRPSLLLATVFLLCNALVDWNYLIFGVWFMLFSYLYLMLRRKKWWLPDVAIKSVVAFGGVILVLSPLIVPMVRAATSGQFSGMGGHNAFVVDLSALFTPFPHHVLGNLDLVTQINDSHTSWASENTGYLGLAALAVFIWQFRAIMSVMSKFVIGGVSFVLMAIGAQPHFFGWLIPALVPARIVPLLPVLSNSRAPSRFIVFVYLFWSLIVAAGVGILWQRYKDSPKVRGWVIAVVVFVLGLDYYGTITESSPVELPACYSAITSDDSKFGILDLPGGYLPSARSMMYQSMHNVPIVQGWVSRRVGKTLLDRLDLRDLEKQRRQLDSAAVKYIVVHKEFLPDTTLDPAQYRGFYPAIYDDSLNTIYRVY